MLNEKKVVSKLRQEVKVKLDIVTSDDIKIHYTEKFQDFTARYISIKNLDEYVLQCLINPANKKSRLPFFVLKCLCNMYDNLNRG